MKIFSSLLIASVLVAFSYESSGVNYRPYISTRLAKVIMTDTEEVVEKKCDGSGWITHGDGHKTECPGCLACRENVLPNPDQSSACKPQPSTNRNVKKKLRPLQRISKFLGGN